MLHVVTKRFRAGGKDLKMGDVVETGGWRNERLLLEHRYIAHTDATQPTITFGNSAKNAKRPSLLSSPIRGRKKKSKASKRGRS